jgi:hypothetical protein
VGAFFVFRRHNQYTLAAYSVTRAIDSFFLFCFGDRSLAEPQPPAKNDRAVARAGKPGYIFLD